MLLIAYLLRHNFPLQYIVSHLFLKFWYNVLLFYELFDNCRIRGKNSTIE